MLLHSSVTPPLPSLDPLSQWVGGARCLIWFTTFPTPQYVPQGSSLPNFQGSATRQSSTGNVPGVPHQSFDHIQVDLVGTLPSSNGFTYLLTVVDCFTCWPEAIPLPDNNTLTCVQALVMHWITCFGVPMDMSSDRGSQSTSQLWVSISQLLGTKLHHTTAY